MIVYRCHEHGEIPVSEVVLACNYHKGCGSSVTAVKFCPHAQRCVHPCDEDECFLESLEHPNGPAVALTKEQCDDLEARCGCKAGGC